MQSEALVPGVTEEEQEITRLVDTYSPMLLGMCSLMLNDRDLAQDIVQETLVRAWKHRSRLKENEKGWLVRVAANLCRDYHRSRWWRYVDHRQCADEMELVAPAFETNEILELVQRLPLKEKEVIVLFFWNNMTADEIAAAAGISRASVYRRLEKAKQHLKLELEGEWQR